MEAMLKPINPVHSLIPNLFIIYFNIIIPSDIFSATISTYNFQPFPHWAEMHSPPLMVTYIQVKGLQMFSAWQRRFLFADTGTYQRKTE
jgi:hypothetical protein